MKNKKKDNKVIIIREKEWYNQKISELTQEIENVWILQEIVRFIENIQK